MKSLRELYKIGNGPSSSHTMGPQKAARLFLERTSGVSYFRVTLYGSLAATGRGHMTDRAILEVLEPVAPTEIIWRPEVFLPFHPNGMLFEALSEGEVKDCWTIYSIGGGALANEETKHMKKGIYPLTAIAEIIGLCRTDGCYLWEDVELGYVP